MRLKHGFACLLYWLSLSLCVAAPEQQRYEPSESVLVGHIVQKTFPGPPNYEDISAGDAKETVWVLMLDKPITVLGDPGSDTNSTTEKGVKRLQVLWFGTKDPNPRLLGPTVTIKGSLFHGQTGHHHTSVMLHATEIRSDAVTWKETAKE